MPSLAQGTLQLVCCGIEKKRVEIIDCEYKEWQQQGEVANLPDIK